jgi:hypothetical protein
MGVYKDQISVKGKQVEVNAIKIEDKVFVVKGAFLKIAALKAEDEVDIENPSAIVAELAKCGLGADILTFRQRIPDSEPKFQDYYMEWDNFAVIPISSYEHWWDKQIRFKARNKFRKAEKSGITIQQVPFSDELVRGLMDIYNETPIRQGRPFWHYGKDFDTVKNENATYPDSSYFIAAHHNTELIGLVKFVNYGKYASIMQIISKIKDRDKAPNNGLIAKAVEICANEGIPHFVYANFIYGKKGADNITEFKESAGFEKVDVPRYYIPLSLKGKLAMKYKLHHGFKQLLPEKAVLLLLDYRNRWNKFKLAFKKN